jgi:hypothetical protein
VTEALAILPMSITMSQDPRKSRPLLGDEYSLRAQHGRLYRRGCDLDLVVRDVSGCVGSEGRRGRRTLAMSAFGRACVRGGTHTGPLGSGLESRTTKRPVDVGFQVVPRPEPNKRDDIRPPRLCTQWRRIGSGTERAGDPGGREGNVWRQSASDDNDVHTSKDASLLHSPIVAVIRQPDPWEEGQEPLRMQRGAWNDSTISPRVNQKKGTKAVERGRAC